MQKLAQQRGHVRRRRVVSVNGAQYHLIRQALRSQHLLERVVWLTTRLVHCCNTSFTGRFDRHITTRHDLPTQHTCYMSNIHTALAFILHRLSIIDWRMTTAFPSLCRKISKGWRQMILYGVYTQLSILYSTIPRKRSNLS